jgi:Big-like domain-containing protein
MEGVMKGVILGILIGAVGLSACSDSTTGMTGTTGTALLSVSPANNATNVSPNASMVVTFSGPMMAGMEQYVDLHPGNLGAATMPMTCNWSANTTVLTCTPNSPLAGSTTYLLHCGGGMQDANGHQVGMMTGPMAGTMVTSGMMPGGMHGGQQMGMMGAGWKGMNNTFGMMFTFSTP